MCPLDLDIRLNFNISRGACYNAHLQSLYMKFRTENVKVYRHFKKSEASISASVVLIHTRSEDSSDSDSDSHSAFVTFVH